MADIVEPTITEREARKLTDKIRDCLDSILSEADEIRTAVAEAHERRADKALGFPSWAAYVEAEFGMSRGNAYRLVTQGKVIAAIEEAAPNATVSRRETVSARQAATLKQNPDAMEQAKAFVAAGTPAKEAAAKAIIDVESKPARTGDADAALRVVVQLGRKKLVDGQKVLLQQAATEIAAALSMKEAR